MGIRYVTAAIFMSGTSTWSAELFASALGYVGPALLIAAIVALVIGVCFIASGIVQDSRKK